MFYTTNTYCYISLCDVEMVYSKGMDTFLLCACNTNQRGWGTAGANGSECVLYTVDQDMDGNLIYDTWSYLGVYMTKDSDLEGAILCREDNGDRGCDVYMDATSEWTVTGDSVVRDFYTGGAEIEDDNDNIVSIVGEDGTEYVKGDSPYTITVTGTYGTDDLTGFENVPGIGTVADGEFTFDTNAAEYVDLSYIPTSPDGKVYEDAAWEGALAAAPTEAPAVETPASATEPAETAAPAAPAPTPEPEPPEAPADTEPSSEAPAGTTSNTPVIIGLLALVVVLAVVCVVLVAKKKKKN